MAHMISITKILNITIILIMNSLISSGSFFENFLYHTSIHLRKESKLNHANGLDPLHFERTLSMNDPNLRLDLSFNGFLKGHTNYNLEKMAITPDLNVSFVGTLIDTQISGSYKMNGSYFTVLPIVGDGIYLFKLKNLGVALDTKIQPKGGHIQIHTFDVDYIFDDFEISLWGLTGDQAVGNILEEFAKDFITVILCQKKDTITKHLKSYVLEEGNAKLKNMTFANMIEVVKQIFVY
ncbi:unnamed protein product [Nezara viridula]|uniref:Uncharacterized protein n=1 Tax=Nezara viridula TaxID=85310 RepID=A0A9P0MLJ7_NEZVI|nr:unnamed protein product [Nezara viridula]